MVLVLGCRWVLAGQGSLEPTREQEVKELGRIWAEMLPEVERQSRREIREWGRAGF